MSARPGRWRATLLRSALFFALWLMISGRSPADLPVGLVTAVAAAMLSLRLLPPTGLRLKPAAMLAYAGHFVAQSVRSGVQVALLALRPTVALRPGFVRYRTRLPDDGRRAAFCAVASLMPGTLPTGFDADGTLLVHCLDVGQPAAAELAAEDARFGRMIADE